MAKDHLAMRCCCRKCQVVCMRRCRLRAAESDAGRVALRNRPPKWRPSRRQRGFCMMMGSDPEQVSLARGSTSEDCLPRREGAGCVSESK